MTLAHTAFDSFATRRNRHLGCGAWLVFVTLTLLVNSGALHATQREPYIPANTDVVLQNVPPTTDPRVRAFDEMRGKLKQNPEDTITAVALARAYVDYGRSTGDARFLGRAMAVIQPWMKQPTPPIPVLLVHATVQQSRHFFQASRAELAHILDLDPGNVQAWLNLATITMVQGDMQQANAACVKLATYGGKFLGLACSASLRSLTGRADQAYALLSLIRNPGTGVPASTKAWIEGLMADTAARMGKVEAAEKHFKHALQWVPGDNFLLAAYADFLLDQDRPHEVMTLLGNYTDSDTSFLRLVRAEAALGLPEADSDAAEMAARFAAMDQRGSHVYRREQAQFALHVQHEPQRALQLAIQNWKVQRAPKDARIYLQSALAADAPAKAEPVMDFIARTHLSSVHIDPLVRKIQAAKPADSQQSTGARTPASDAP